MRILIVSDAAPPQVNGVVRTLQTTILELTKLGHEVKLIGPDDFVSMPMPLYKEIRLPLFTGKLGQMIEDFKPDSIHIATEAVLGRKAKKHCLKMGYRYTSTYHTRFPEFIKAKLGIPVAWTLPYFRRFHSHSSCLMVSTDSLVKELGEQQFNNNIKIWGRGVDIDLFHPSRRTRPLNPKKQRYTCISRISHEKNIEAFCELDLDVEKVVVGSGPLLKKLQKKYPDVKFLGKKTGVELATEYADADVFVFPSKADTFGLVVLEALASGTPVAAFDVPGPADIVINGKTGWCDDDLEKACLIAKPIPRQLCRAYAETCTWEKCTKQFFDNLVPIK
jgi:glycosyltransferase involved in cell wall biosynthesis